MEAMMRACLKSDTAHNIAQRVLTGEDIYGYLSLLAGLLFSWQEEGHLTLDEVHEVYLHAWGHGQQEADYVLKMYNEQGIELKTSGNSGSQIHPAIALQKYIK